MLKEPRLPNHADCIHTCSSDQIRVDPQRPNLATRSTSSYRFPYPHLLRLRSNNNHLCSSTEQSAGARIICISLSTISAPRRELASTSSTAWPSSSASTWSTTSEITASVLRRLSIRLRRSTDNRVSVCGRSGIRTAPLPPFTTHFEYISSFPHATVHTCLHFPTMSWEGELTPRQVPSAIFMVCPCLLSRRNSSAS